MRLKEFTQIARRTVSEWIDDKASTLAAALSYYTVFSIAPVLIIAVAVAGFVFGADATRGRIQAELQGLVGDAGAKVIENMMVSASKPSSGIIATAIGIIVLLLGASGVFAQLQESLNVIWKVNSTQTSGILTLVLQRFLSFAMVLGIGFLLLVSLVLSAALSAIGSYLQGAIFGGEALWQLVNLAVSFGVITFLFALIYKVLPQTRVEWRDVWLGAAVTSFLFSIGKFAIGLYLGKSSVASSYGAAGAVIVILLWVYYAALILFLGAEFAQVYAKHRRSRLPPDARPGEKTEQREIPHLVEVPPSTWLPI